MKRKKIVLLSVFILIALLSAIFLSIFLSRNGTFYPFVYIQNLLIRPSRNGVSLPPEVDPLLRQTSNVEQKRLKLSQTKFRRGEYTFENGLIESKENNQMTIFLPNSNERVNVDLLDSNIIFQKADAEKVEKVSPDVFTLYGIVSVKRNIKNNDIVMITWDTYESY